MKAAAESKEKTTAPNQLWQTDFTYLKVTGWGWFYLSTVLDDFSRYIIAWKLCSNMRAEDVTDTLDMALAASGCDQATVQHKPRLLSDNGPSYIAGELAEYIEANKMSHVRGAPMHPQTQGKIERWHQTLKNRILLENYFRPGDLERQIEAFWERSAPKALDHSIAKTVSATYPRHIGAIVKLVEDDYGSCNLRTVQRRLRTLVQRGHLLRIDLGKQLYAYLRPNSKLVNDIELMREQCFGRLPVIGAAHVTLLRGTTHGADCLSCPFSTNGEPTRPVTSEYPEDPKWILVGECPGRTEVQLNRPFQGGQQLLEKILAKIGRRRDEIVLTTAALCAPPVGAAEHDRERAAMACKGRLQQELAQWPGMPVLTLGATAARTLIPKATLDESALAALCVPAVRETEETTR